MDKSRMEMSPFAAQRVFLTLSTSGDPTLLDRFPPPPQVLIYLLT